MTSSCKNSNCLLVRKKHFIKNFSTTFDFVNISNFISDIKTVTLFRRSGYYYKKKRVSLRFLNFSKKHKLFRKERALQLKFYCYLRHYVDFEVVQFYQLALFPYEIASINHKKFCHTKDIFAFLFKLSLHLFLTSL